MAERQTPLPEPQPQLPTVAAAWRPELRGSPEETGSITPPQVLASERTSSTVGPAIQAGSFRNKENAERARAVLSGIAPVDVDEVDVGGEIFYRVRVGPFHDEIAAASALPQVTEAGYQGARILFRN
ncbi:MAG: SPOR domain-containing protein [Planctomycetaceae bacterium]